jgi:TatD DNase family protein
MIIDAHCHFDMTPNPERYIREREVAGNIVIGMTNLPSHFQMGVEHVKTLRHVRLALGMHPLLAKEGLEELALFRRYVDQTSYIGEIGLDFSRAGYSTRDLQIRMLRDVLSALKGKKKIISVHSRRAENELLELLTEYDIKNVIYHWYTGPVGLIAKMLDRGYYFSVNEAMCLSKNGQAILKKIPKERILTETDAPYNESTDIRKVLQYLEMSEEDVYHNLMCLLNNLR